MTADAVYTEQITALIEGATPVVSRWSYQVNEPYTVSVAFQTEPGAWVEWVFARELLVDGLAGPAGIGDVRLRPRRTPGRTALVLEIESPEGHAVLELDREAASRFLNATTRMVPLGAEPDYFDVDALIDEITNV